MTIIYQKKKKLGDLILENPQLLRLIYRFGISPGFGDATIEEVCLKHKIDPEFLLVIINSFLDNEFSPSNILDKSDLKQLISYLKKTHEYYLSVEIPFIELMIEDLCSDPLYENPDLVVVKRFFSAYKKELTEHINREEKKTFPYVLLMEEQLYSKTPGNKSSDSYSILAYEEEHDNMEEKLFDLKNIMIKYLPEPFNHETVNRIIAELFWLEKDLHDHARIEDKVLVPKVKELESRLKAITRKTT
jgi:regulator of cell morphogenesis and NO signaling